MSDLDAQLEQPAAGLALRGPCFTSAERNAEDYAFARDLGLPISVHVGMAGTAGAITTLQSCSLLGADVNYVHGNMLTDREFDLIAETQGSVTITPSTDMRSPHLDGFGDPVAVMVLGAGAADVETVIVGGDVVKRDGKLAGDHVGHALELMHATREHLRC
jgi:cytosine/adenosine deaminase-related metal-dependent hydrolase